MDILSCALLAGQIFIGSNHILFPTNGSFFFSLDKNGDEQILTVRNYEGMKKQFLVPDEFHGENLSEVFYSACKN